MEQYGYDAVVFDMDGVIFDSERLVVECWNEIAGKHGIGNMDEICRKCMGLTVEASRGVMTAYFGEDFPYDEYKAEMSQLFHKKYDHGKLPLKPGVEELLSFLKQQGKKVALASSTRSRIVRQELEDAGIISYFDALICGDMVKNSKPAPDIFAKACECLGVKPERAFGIEDSHNGIRSASAAGLKPIMIPDLVPVTEEMERLTVKILPSLNDLKEYFQTEFQTE